MTGSVTYVPDWQRRCSACREDRHDECVDDRTCECDCLLPFVVFEGEGDE